MPAIDRAMADPDNGSWHQDAIGCQDEDWFADAKLLDRHIAASNADACTGPEAHNGDVHTCCGIVDNEVAGREITRQVKHDRAASRSECQNAARVAIRSQGCR